MNDFQRQFKSFSKFVDLTFGVFPLKTNAIEKVIKLIFSDGGIFKCIEEGYEQPTLQLTDVLAQRAQQFIPNAELVMLKAHVFPKSIHKLEDVWRKVKSILDKIRNQSCKLQNADKPPLLRRKSSVDMSEKSFASKDANSAVPMVEVTERNDKIFMLTFATFHLSTIDNSSSLTADYVLKN